MSDMTTTIDTDMARTISEEGTVEMVSFINTFNAVDSTYLRERITDLSDRNGVSSIFICFVLLAIDEMETLSKHTGTFDVKEVVQVAVVEVMRKMVLETSREHLHFAPTQSGKTSFKTVLIITFLTMNMPVVVVTKGVSECKELYDKMINFVKGYRYESQIKCPYKKNKNLTNDYQVYIIPDTYQKIEEADIFLQNSMDYAKQNGRRHTRCALILDEFDAIIDRSEQQNQKNEIAMNKLRKCHKPHVVKVSATILPTLLRSSSEIPDEQLIVTTSNKSINNYVGVQNMQLVDHLNKKSIEEGFSSQQRDGKLNLTYDVSDKNGTTKLLLFPDDKVQDRTKFPKVWEKKNPKVPKINHQIIKHLRREINKPKCKGMLALIDTCPYVNTTKNIFRQAAGVQDYFFHIGKKVIAIVVHADFLFYRLGGHAYAIECKRSLSELIDSIDSSKKYGLKTPIMIFGYYSMKRSRSFRSAKRVPSSMIVLLGDGQSNESNRQAMGRLTFIGLDILQQNRNTNKILMLCQEEDFESAQHYDHLTLEIIDLFKNGMTLKDIKSKIKSSKHYFVDNSKRRIGNYVPEKNKKKRFRKGNSFSVTKTDQILIKSLEKSLNTCSTLIGNMKKTTEKITEQQTNGAISTSTIDLIEGYEEAEAVDLTSD